MKTQRKYVVDEDMWNELIGQCRFADKIIIILSLLCLILGIGGLILLQDYNNVTTQYEQHKEHCQMVERVWREMLLEQGVMAPQMWIRTTPHPDKNESKYLKQRRNP